MIAFKIAYWAGIVLQVVIRAPFAMQARARTRIEQRISPTEKTLLILLTVAGGILPLIYTFTNWLSFADYTLPNWLGWAGVLIMALSLLLFWRSHYDLKSNWSSSVELYEGHTLITNGIYRRMRHPMYASQFVEGLAQLLLLQNWIAGPGGLLVFILFYLLRLPAEEQMMLEKFGDQYRAYMKTTGTIFPKY